MVERLELMKPVPCSRKIPPIFICLEYRQALIRMSMKSTASAIEM